MAASGGNIGVMKLLIDMGVEIDALSIGNETPLFKAIEFSQ